MQRRRAVSPLGRLIVTGVLMLAAAALAAADLADVYLRNGLRLRGEVTVTAEAVVVRNAAGEVRFDPADVVQVVPVTPAPETQPGTPPVTQPLPPATQPVTRPAEQSDPPGLPESGEELPEPEGEPVPEVVTPLAPAPAITDEDIQKLKLFELRSDLRREELRVRFKRSGRQRELAIEVLEELRLRPDFDRRWEEVLTRGTVEEKFALILRETGYKYADRIEIVNDPEVFRVFRRRVLPMLTRGCAGSGCHGGVHAREFRFPGGATSGEQYAYAVFALLDRMETSKGPLIHRDLPEQSVLLSFLLPQEETIHGHPPVGRGPRFRPVARRPDDPNYRVVLDWIDSLAMPRPDYQLAYEPLYPGRGVGWAEAGAEQVETRAAESDEAARDGGEPTPSTGPAIP